VGLNNLYEKVNQEFGKPLIIHPRWLSCRSALAEDINRENITGNWAVLGPESPENSEGSPDLCIAWIADGYESITESMGPVETDCPLFFFDIVPDVCNEQWREDVRLYWQSQENKKIS
jgi:hypothetical protein